MLNQNSLLVSQPTPTIKLWTPTVIGVVTFFLGFPCGITLAAINWIKMGLRGKALAHILGGIAGIGLILMLPENATRLLGLVINIGAMSYLRQQMKVDIEGIQNASVQPAHWFGGCLASLATWVVLAGAVVGFVLLQTIFETLTPGHALYYSGRGDDHLKSGNYDQAIAEYTEAIRLDPTLSTIYYNRGLAYSYQGDYDHAISDYSQVITLNPDDEAAYFERGYNLAASGDYEGALADYSRFIQLNPGDAYAYNNRGLIYEELGLMDEAILDFEKVLEITTDAALRQGVEAELRKLKGK